MGDGSWDKFVKRVQDDVTPPAARPRPTTGKMARPPAEEDQRKKESRGVARPERKSDSRPVARPTGKSDSRPVARPTGKSDSRPVARPPGGKKSESRPVARPQRPDTRSQRRPAPAATGGEGGPAAQEAEKQERGRSDLRQEIKAQAKVVPLEKLRKGGTQFVRVIDPRAIERIVGDSVRRALEQHKQLLTSEEREAIERDATSGFTQLLSEHKKLQAEKDQLEAEKSAAEAQRESLAQQVDALRTDLEIEQRRLGDERQRQAERVEGIQFSAQALDELERRVHALLRRMLDAGELTPPGFMTPPDGIQQFHQELEATVHRVMQAERKKRATVGGDATEDAVDLLERRIEKLTRALQETERQLSAAPSDPFAEHRPASAFTEVQGISADDPGFKWRSALLRWVFLTNLEQHGLEISEADRTGPFPGRRLLDSLQRAAAERAAAAARSGGSAAAAQSGGAAEAARGRATAP